MRIITSAALALGVTLASAHNTAQAQERPKHIHVVYDLSQAGLRDPSVIAHLGGVTQEITSEINPGFGDQVHHSSFGGTLAENLGATDFNASFTFAYSGADPRDMANGIAQRLQLLPSTAAQSGQGSLQQLLSDLDLDCSAENYVIAYLNGTEGLSFDGSRADYIGLPTSPLCGSFHFVGWWMTQEPEWAWPGVRKQVEEITRDVLISLGAENVTFHR
ncbi:hypothetical protein KO498_05000 [Lentibacter algarum]|uniref:hypothetical protein n=1 Tax=Lentibacter algarum TaxID=576131 RepID=UPI001C069F99|nr:hypothetical protein [Lentibacter algarum]MBU2981166.1 hypothetical protein [Lentibacter algarum]